MAKYYSDISHKNLQELRKSNVALMRERDELKTRVAELEAHLAELVLRFGDGAKL